MEPSDDARHSETVSAKILAKSVPRNGKQLASFAVVDDRLIFKKITGQELLP